MIKRITEITTATAELNTAQAECIFDEGGYDPTINTPKETEFCTQIAQNIMGKDNVITDTKPSMGAEDFGAMLQKAPGCYLWIGQAEDENSNHSQGLHTPRYDFNDDIIPTAIEYWAQVVENALPLKK